VVIVAPCGFDMARTAQEMHWLVDRPDWRELEAVRSGRVVSGGRQPILQPPGPRVVETLRIITEILRSGFPEGTGWRQVGPASWPVDEPEAR